MGKDRTSPEGSSRGIETIGGKRNPHRKGILESKGRRGQRHTNSKSQTTLLFTVFLVWGGPIT